MSNMMLIALTAFGALFLGGIGAMRMGNAFMRRAGHNNSLPPIITLVGFLVGFLLGAAVLVETIFSWGGLGQYAVQAVTYSDYPALQGFVLVAAVFILVVYLIVDILYELADPRIQV